MTVRTVTSPVLLHIEFLRLTCDRDVDAQGSVMDVHLSLFPPFFPPAPSPFSVYRSVPIAIQFIFPHHHHQLWECCEVPSGCQRRGRDCCCSGAAGAGAAAAAAAGDGDGDGDGGGGGGASIGTGTDSWDDGGSDVVEG